MHDATDITITVALWCATATDFVTLGDLAKVVNKIHRFEEGFTPPKAIRRRASAFRGRYGRNPHYVLRGEHGSARNCPRLPAHATMLV